MERDVTTVPRVRRNGIARIALPAGGAALLVGLVAVLLFNQFGGGADDHYAPSTTPGDRSPLKIGETAPDFTLPNAKNEPVSLRDFRGKPTIFVFFRTFG
jgi:cytochrome oxidase Cu insertion factor (SCO1/SenC/PrrC family)